MKRAPLALLLATALPLAAQGGLRGTIQSGEVRVRGAVVWLEPLGSASASRRPDTLVIDQRGLEFTPGRVALEPGDVVRFPNSDPLRHNVFSPGLRDGSGAFNLGTYPRGEDRLQVFDAPGAYVILCHIHPDMLGWVVVVPSPWHAVVEADGRFGFEGLPAGNYRVHVWHPRARGVPVRVPVGTGAPATVTIELTRP